MLGRTFSVDYGRIGVGIVAREKHAHLVRTLQTFWTVEFPFALAQSLGVQSTAVLLLLKIEIGKSCFVHPGEKAFSILSS